MNTWLRLCGAGALGATAAFGQAPYDQTVIMLIAFIVLFRFYAEQTTARAAALYGWAFGAGYFAHTMHWIVSPFLVDAARHGWMAPFALILMAGGLALFWGLSFWMARRAFPTATWPAACALAGMELLRAHIFTGFPWGMVSQALVNGVMGQALAWVGPYALNLMFLLIAVFLAAVTGRAAIRRMQIAGLVGVLALLLLPPLAPPAPLTGETVRLVQPNAAQRDKMDPDKALMFFERQLDFTAAPPEEGAQPPALVVWPEVAIPWALEEGGFALEKISRARNGAEVILGVLRWDEGRVYNSMALINHWGHVQTYDKHHLVPFGEYVPFADLLARWGIFGLAAQDVGGMSAGPGPQVIESDTFGTGIPLICYEVIFPHNVHSDATGGHRWFMVQITNDAWFGRGAGPKQHLAQARMRAIERRLPLIRSANTGISAVIDPWGRITHSLELNTAGFIDAAMPRIAGASLYGRTGDLPFTVLVLIGLAVFCVQGTRNSR
jgi:apolipoprotein N-acyltransferase